MSISKAMNQELEAMIFSSKRLPPIGEAEWDNECLFLSAQGWTPIRKSGNNCKVPATEAAVPFSAAQ